MSKQEISMVDATKILARLEEVAEEYSNPDCPQCGGMGAYIGELGSLTWFRCINCGWTFSRRDS